MRVYDMFKTFENFGVDEIRSGKFYFNCDENKYNAVTEILKTNKDKTIDIQFKEFQFQDKEGYVNFLDAMNFIAENDCFLICTPDNKEYYCKQEITCREVCDKDGNIKIEKILTTWKVEKENCNENSQNEKDSKNKESCNFKNKENIENKESCENFQNKEKTQNKNEENNCEVKVTLK